MMRELPSGVLVGCLLLAAFTRPASPRSRKDFRVRSWRIRHHLRLGSRRTLSERGRSILDRSEMRVGGVP